MNHSFDVDIAKQYGVNAAIIFQNIGYWCEHSRANESNYYDGFYWTYNTNKAFCELFPYMSGKGIRTAIQKLIDADMIQTGNYNKLAYDRTLWYALSKKGECIYRKGQMEIPESANGNSQKGKPIPNINTDINTNISMPRKRVKGESSPGFDRFYSVYPKKVARATALKAWKKSGADDSQTLTDTIIADVQRRIEGEWKGRELQYIPHPSTYINQRRWEDETTGTDKVEYEEPILTLQEQLRRGGYFAEDE